MHVVVAITHLYGKMFICLVVPLTTNIYIYIYIPCILASTTASTEDSSVAFTIESNEWFKVESVTGRGRCIIAAQDIAGADAVSSTCILITTLYLHC